MAAMF